MSVYVEIVEHVTGEVVKRMGPMSEHQADKVESGVEINLNHERFYVRIVGDEADQPATGRESIPATTQNLKFGGLR